MNDIHRNEAELEGLVQTPPAYSHENHGKPFYRCLLSVPRLSGQTDLLPLLLPEEATRPSWMLSSVQSGSASSMGMAASSMVLHSRRYPRVQGNFLRDARSRG